jgi:hypothetical protein
MPERSSRVAFQSTVSCQGQCYTPLIQTHDPICGKSEQLHVVHDALKPNVLLQPLENHQAYPLDQYGGISLASLTLRRHISCYIRGSFLRFGSHHHELRISDILEADSCGLRVRRRLDASCAHRWPGSFVMWSRDSAAEACKTLGRCELAHKGRKPSAYSCLVSRFRNLLGC